MVILAHPDLIQPNFENICTNTLEFLLYELLQMLSQIARVVQLDSMQSFPHAVILFPIRKICLVQERRKVN